MKFAKEANEDSVSTLSATEKALSDADLITDEDLVDYKFDRSLEANKDFIAQIIRKMPESDRAGLIQNNGNIAQQGIDRVRYALVAKAYKHDSILDDLTSIPVSEDSIKNLSNALRDAAPQMAKFEASHIRPELSLHEDIFQAVKLFKQIKENGRTVEEYLATSDMFHDATPEALKLLEFFGTKKKTTKRFRSASVISDALKNYAKLAMSEVQEGQGTLTNDVFASKGQLLDSVLNDVYDNEAQAYEIRHRKKMEVTTLTEEDYRRNVEKQILDIGRSQEEASALSQLYMLFEKNFAKLTGQNLGKSINSERLRFEYHDSLGENKAQLTFKDGEAILKISQMADKSSILHEFGHLFLDKVHRLERKGQLKGILKEDWDALLKAYKTTTEALTKDKTLYKEFHEQFATDFERYLYTGEVSNAQLKGIFEKFKEWLRDVYASFRKIKYVGADGKMHYRVKLSNEAKQFFDDLLSDKYEQTDNATINEAQSQNGNTETHNQIGKFRKSSMDTLLRMKRRDLTAEQRQDAISEIEMLGELSKEGGDSKVEKIATKWLLDGHIILPEDNYKVLDAIKISEQQHIDPMKFKDPNEILAKYTIRETRAEKRINPDTVSAFSNKKDYGNGITVYDVENSKRGLYAVRSIIDTHWGEKANPWCLARRSVGYPDAYENA